MPQQLELFSDSPFAFRLKIDEAMRIFKDNYWIHLPFGKKSGAVTRKILDFFKDHYLDTISKSDIERMRRFYREAGYSESTINKVHMTLSRLYTKFYEYREGKFLNGTDFSRLVLPEKNPASQVPRVNERRFARKLEITMERKKILCGVADPELAEIIDGLWWTMLRQGDFFSITSENVHMDQLTITGIQRKSITTKNPSGLPYKVTIPEDRIAMISSKLMNTKPVTPLFRNKNIKKRWYETRAKAARLDPELSKVQLRDIRGGASSFLLDAGTDLETLRKKGGWASTEMIPHYDKRTDESLKRATEKLVEISP